MSDDMQRFLTGHWTKSKPTRPGVYPVRTSDGHEVGPSGWILFYELDDKVHQTKTWGGEFWSEPWPGMPSESGAGLVTRDA